MACLILTWYILESFAAVPRDAVGWRRRNERVASSWKPLCAERENKMIVGHRIFEMKTKAPTWYVGEVLAALVTAAMPNEPTAVRVGPVGRSALDMKGRSE